MDKTKVHTEYLDNLMTQVCLNRRITKNGAECIVRNYLEAEIRGKITHGISKFCFESQFFSERMSKPLLVVDTGALIKIDGNREVGPIAATFCTKLAAQRAKKYGIAMVGINNIQRYGILGTWTEHFCEERVFGIVINTCEPAMTGYKGKRKILGTNPISFAVLTPDEIFVVDMATSKVAMSLIWQCLRDRLPLPDNTFLDEGGSVTTVPSEAKAVKHFDGIKGYSIALLIQLLCGSVFGFKMGHGIKRMYDIGYVFIAIDQEKTTSFELMLKSNKVLIDKLRQSGAIIPGGRSNKLKDREFIEVSTKALKELEVLSKTKIYAS